MKSLPLTSIDKIKKAETIFLTILFRDFNQNLKPNMIQLMNKQKKIFYQNKKKCRKYIEGKNAIKSHIVFK